MDDLLIYGGFNWIGYELINYFVSKKQIRHFIIIDNLSYLLDKDLIKNKLDEYRHLYNENIYFYNIHIKDKQELQDVYEKFNIKYVVNNIKYNIKDDSETQKNKIRGYNNIKELNNKYNIKQSIHLIREYSHNTILLNNQNKNFKYISKMFNNTVIEIFKKDFITSTHDYVYGELKDKHNDIFELLKRIYRSGTPFISNLKNNAIIVLDKDLIDCIIKYLVDKIQLNIKVNKITYEEILKSVID